MAKKESVQKRLEKVRPPRVQLSYDVQIGDAIQATELPFVVGVLGDFTGKPDPNKPAPKLKDRKFVSVDRDNFDAVLTGMAPNASYKVKNRLSADGGEFNVDLKFKKFEDFRPEAVVRQVKQLKQLLDARNKLEALRNTLAGNEELEDILGDVLNNTEKLQKLSRETTKKQEST